jgi:hypothetical protein
MSADWARPAFGKEIRRGKVRIESQSRSDQGGADGISNLLKLELNNNFQPGQSKLWAARTIAAVAGLYGRPGTLAKATVRATAGSINGAAKVQATSPNIPT